MTIPSPGGSERRPRSPRMRLSAVSATTQRSQTTWPSSSRRRTSAPGGPATSDASAAEDLADREHDGPEENDEHRRKDEKDEREQELDRRPLRPLLRHRAPTLAHFDRKVAHDLAGRGAERFALKDGADEGPHARRIRTSEHPLQRLVRRQAHPLLLQRDAELDAERSVEA